MTLVLQIDKRMVKSLKQKISIGIGIGNRPVTVSNFLLLTSCNILWFIFLIKENWIGCLVINTCSLLLKA